MARRVGKLRPSPNEEAQLIQEERERRRILRIQQVREQQKNFALQTRQNVEQRRQRELELLGKELREEWEQQQSEKLHTLQMLYEQSLQMVGQGQRMAKENEPDLAAINQREALNHAKAEERFRDALKELKSQRLKDSEMQSRTINARKKALQVEKERSSKVANLPPPPSNPILQAIDSAKSNVGRKADISAFASTRYHMPVATVDRAEETQQADAHEGAELAMKRLVDLQRDCERKRAEQIETARLRGKTALRKEHRALDRDRLLVELEHMQQADMLRRRQQAFQIPPVIFQPPHRRQEMKDDFQRDMEFAFEDMYTRERKIKGDLVGRLVPEPLPAVSTSSQDSELDVTLDETTTSKQEKSTVDPASQDSAHVKTDRAAPRQALKNLLNRIRTQRSESTSGSGGIPDAHSLVTVASRVSERDADVIPERDAVVRPEEVAESAAVVDKEAVSEQDTTIDTGSLSSQPTQPPSLFEAVNPSSQPGPADTQDRDDLSSKILEFEAERKKREMELEREKQQQMALLHELEDQKAHLEQLLLRAQQDGKQQKAQEIPLNQAEVPPVHGQEVYGDPQPLTPEHTRRIRECQARLLEQNRIHQQSMDLARRRLEEYQRALQSRHNMATPPPPLLHLRSTEPQIAAEFTSPRSAGPAMPPSVPSSSASFAPTLQTAEPCESLIIPRHQQQEISDLAPLMRKVVSRVAERARSPPTTTDTLPSQPVIREALPPKMVTRELLPPEVVIRGPIPPEVVTRVPIHPRMVSTQPVAPQVSTTDSLPRTPIVTRESLPFTMVTRESLSLPQVIREPLPQLVTTEPAPSRVVTRESLHPQPVTREVLTPQVVTRESLHPQPVTREVLTPQAVTRESLHPQPVRREVLNPQTVVRESFTLKPVTTEFLPSKTVTTSLPFRRPIQTVTEGRFPQFGTPAEDDSDQEGSQEFHERQREGKRESLEELRQRQQDSLELLRQEKETLRALINVDSQLHSEDSAEDDAGQSRSGLLSSLLKIIEESNGGSLTQPGHLQTEVNPRLQPPFSSETVSPVSLHAPARAGKPPVTRDRLGMMREQHELSAIQEVETPVNTSLVTGPEDVFSLPHHTRDWSLQEPYESSVTTEHTLQTPSVPSSRKSTPPLSRKNLVMGTGISPDTSEHGSYQHISSNSERGSDSFDMSITSLTLSDSLPHATRAPGGASLPSTHGTTDLECLSTTTLSTGSYITSDPEAGKSPTLGAAESSQLGTSSSHAAGQPQAALPSALFSGGNVQRIIDRYTQELDVSFSAVVKSTVSVLEELHPLGQATGRQEDDDEASRVTLPSQAAHTTDMNHDQTAHPITEQLSICEDQDSFRPLIGQPGDQSSYLLTEQRDTGMEPLVGQPSAHSSMIGQPSGPPLSAGWDSESHHGTSLSHITEQVSQESSQRRHRDERDSCAGQLTSRTEPSLLDEHPEESSMRPLVAELDVSSGQDSGSSGERTVTDLSALSEAAIVPHVSSPPEASDHSASVPGVNPLPPAAVSFHPLPAEVTNNETAPDPSAVFHDSSNGRLSSGELSTSAHSDLQSHDGVSESEQSTEHFRAEDDSRQTSAWHCVDSPQAVQLSQSDASDTSSPFSILPEDNVEEEPQGVQVPIADPLAEVKAEHNLNLRMDLTAKLPEAGSTKGILEQSQITLLSLTDITLQDSIEPEEEVMWAEEEQKGHEESQTTIMKEPSGALKDYQSSVHAGMLLEFNWGSRDQGHFEEKRQSLLKRSARRVEHVKAKGALARSGAAAEGSVQSGERPLQTKAQSAHRWEQVKDKGAPGKTGAAAEVCRECPAQTQQEAKVDNSKTAKSTLVKQQKSPTPPATSISTKLNEHNQVKSSKQEVTEMHKRTQRLYEQLEEVKLRKAVQSRQEAYARNRQKAKAFHMVNHHTHFPSWRHYAYNGALN
ncbi:centrosomal protein of 295 kDa isoform X3 [Hippocampus comes]|uniref:centrosomal protein of 295 kDa isoform X3 n=1 Tax=Hippocampus comes TaxID=109280 RepID=UPI00094E12D8|nr:PREDICTED: centrosomal protein of 295 kDa isoform X3 [Hippocampus comes]